MPKDDRFQMDFERKVESSFSNSETSAWTPKYPTEADILAEIRREPVRYISEQPKVKQEQPASSPPTVPAPSKPTSEEEVVETKVEVDSTPDEPEEEEEQNVTLPPSSNEDFSIIQSSIGSVEQEVKMLADSSAKIAGEVREMHKLYHNEFAKRLISMQDELERYREIEKGRFFDGILGEVAKLYSDHEALLEDVIDEKLKKRIRYLFEDIVQVLEAHSVSKQKSNPGDKRNTRHCQVRERISTSNVELHDTVAKSGGTGFYIENRSLIKEPVDIYLYSDNADAESADI